WGRWNIVAQEFRLASAPSPGEPAFRVGHEGEVIDDADTIEGARGIVRDRSPGCYRSRSAEGGDMPVRGCMWRPAMREFNRRGASPGRRLPTSGTEHPRPTLDAQEPRPMAALAADRNLLLGLLALQNGLINQVQLVAAFQAWTLDKARALADHLL